MGKATPRRWRREQGRRVMAVLARSQVYAISAEDCPLVKIGWTSGYAEARLIGFQPHSPLVLELIWSQPGNWRMEKALHQLFSARRRRFEWFDFSDTEPVALIQEGYERQIFLAKKAS